MSRAPEPHAPESDDPDDILIASDNLNSRYPWRDPAKQVPYGRVLLIAAKLKWSPAAVVSRLGALGYADIQRSDGPLPAVVEPDDVPLITGVDRRFGAHPVDVDTTVSLRQIVESAALADCAPAEAARRMTALGYQVGTGARPLPETANSRDVVLIRKDRRGGWFEWGDDVPTGHVLEVAQELSCSPRFAAERLIALGLRLPYTPEPGDERLLNYADTPGGGWISRWGSAPVAHILTVARETGRSHADLLARLRELGTQPPDGNVPDTPEADDFVILSENLDGRAPWLPKNNVVGLQVRHILRAARVTGRSPASIAGRLTALGHWLHDNANLPATADEADIALLDTVTRSYLDDVHLENVLRSASLTGRSPADVAARLTALGYRLPDEVEYPDVRPGVRTG
ncbi:wHTH domain-containing protein [Streptomyces niveus]